MAVPLENQNRVGQTRLKKHIQKSFHLLKHATEISKTVMLECLPHIATLVSLYEQHMSCHNVRSETLPFITKFPDIKEKLLMKIGTDIDEKISLIKYHLCALKIGQQKLKKQLDVTMTAYRKYLDDLDIETMTLQTAVCPSMAEMLEWLTFAEKLLYNQYHMKMYLLESLADFDHSRNEYFSDAWRKEDSETYQTIEDYLCCVSFFMEEAV